MTTEPRWLPVAAFGTFPQAVTRCYTSIVIRIGWPRWPRSAEAAPPTLVVGLNAEDLMSLVSGQEKRFSATVPGLGSFQVALAYGRTNEDIADRLVLEQLMPITAVRKSPEAADA